jgi:hypothetical protein
MQTHRYGCLRRLRWGQPLTIYRPKEWLTLGWSLFAISWLLPNHYNPWLNFHSEAMAFASIAVLMTTILLAQGSAPEHWPATALWVAGAALIPWVQWILGISPFAGDSLIVSYYLIGWAIAMMIGYHIGKRLSGQSELALMSMLCIAAFLSAIVGLLQWLKLEEYLGVYAAQTDIGDPAMGNLAQPNQLGTLLLMGMVAFAYLCEQRIIGIWTLALSIVILTAVLALTHSRSGMIGLFAVGAFLQVKRSVTNTRIQSWQILSWMLLFILMSVVSPHVDRALFLSTDTEPLFTANGRILIWSQTWEGIRQAPWTGYGWNQTFSTTSVGSLRHPGVLIATYAHNVLLDMVAWNGWPIGLLLIGLGGYWFFTRLRRVSGVAGTYSMACLLPFTIHSLVELSFAYAYFLLAAGALIGVVEASLAGARSWRVSRTVIGLVFAIWITIGAGIAYEYILLEEDVRVTRFENLRVGATNDSYHIPEIKLLTHMATLQRATRLQPVPHMTDSQLDDMRLAVMRFPGGGLALRYAMALAMNGDPTGARHTMDVIRGIYGAAFFEQATNIWNQQSEKDIVLKAIDLQN